MKSKSRMTKVLVWSVFPIALVVLSLQPGRAQAATFVVNSTADVVDAAPGNGSCATAAGVCTLRAAIQEANALAGADTITLPAGTYTLSIPGVNEDYCLTGDLDITSDLTITSAGANTTTIDAGGIDRVLEIRWENKPNVSISGLTVTGGKTLSTQPGGGSGGGIQTQGALLTLTNVTVSGNTAGNQGGGIFKAGPLILNSCTVSNNTAGYEPGTPGGGGIMDYINGKLTLNNSTISGNSSPFGGGIGSSNYSLDISMTNSTVSNNTGGGLRVRAGTVTMKNIIMANGSFNCSFYGVGSSVLNSLGHNLSTDNSCTSNSIVIPGIVSGGLDPLKGDLNNTPAQIAPLALNSPGSTKTHALLPGSPAIDKGADCLTVDQRGVPRPQGAACDIGAYEVGSAPPAAACATPPSGMVAWWPGEDHANDIWGSNDGTLVAGAKFDPNGKVGSAFKLTSSGPPPAQANTTPTSEYINVPTDPSVDPLLVTVDAWIKTTFLPTPLSPGPFAAPIFIVDKAGPSNTQAGYQLFYLGKHPVDSKLTGTVQFLVGAGAGKFGIATGITPVADGNWHHIAGTYDGLEVRVYVDGKLDGKATYTGGIIYDKPVSGPLSIGRREWPGYPNGYYDGLIDEVELFNRALSQQEIQTIFNAGSEGKCKCVPPPSGLVSWWPGDGNANDNKDGNNGTISGGMTFVSGKVGQAFNFDGSNSVQIRSSASLLPPEQITVDGWIKPLFSGRPFQAADADIIIEKFDYLAKGYVLSIAMDPTSSRFFEVPSGGVPLGTPAFFLNVAGIRNQIFGPSPIPNDGSFHFVAGTYDGTMMRLFLDGIEVASRPVTGSIEHAGTAEISIGRANVVPRNSKAAIDEVEIFNRALSQSEIQAIFKAGSAGKCKTAVSPNKPPLANAGPDQTVEAASPSGASVTLNGSGSSDPDSNPLTYNWTGPFGTVSAVSHTVTLPLGTHTVTLKVNDGQATATDTVNITVHDTTPPDTMINSAVDGKGATVASGGSTLSNSITFTFGGTDAVGATAFQCSLDGAAYGPCSSPVGYSSLAIGSHSFQVRALDAAGNVDASPASFSWTVITPAQAIQNLITSIGNMGLPGGVANSLTAPLSNINTNNKAAACGKLNAFINQVNTKVQNGQLTAAQASQLLTEANAIKASLGC